MTVTPNLVRLDINNHQVIGKGGGQTEVVGEAVGTRIDNKDKGILVGASPSLEFSEGKPNWGERVYIYLKVDDPTGIKSVRIRMVREGTPWSGHPADSGGYAEWDVDMTGYTGGWLRVRVDPYNEPWDRQGPSRIGNDPRFAWIGVMFDMENVPGKDANCWVSSVDIGTGIAVHDIPSELDWEGVHAIDDYGMVQEVGPSQYELIGDVQLESVLFDSVGEHVTLKNVDLVVGAGSDFRSSGLVVNSEGDGHIDFDDAQFVSIDDSLFNDVVGDAFTGYSVRFADDSLHTVMDSTFTRCGKLVQQSTQFSNVQVVTPTPQPDVFTLVKAYRVWQDINVYGTDELRLPEGRFEPFETFEDNVGDLYWVGAPVPFNKMFFEGDLFGGNSEPNWSYWTTAGWTALEVSGEKANLFNGEMTFVAPPDWQKLDGLYQLRWQVVQGLYAVAPNPKHRFAFYTPVV